VPARRSALVVDAPETESASAAGAFIDYFRCPADFAALDTAGPLSADERWFTFGSARCYGQVVERPTAANAHNWRPLLPFNLSQVATNLRHERYPQALSRIRNLSRASVVRSVYYAARPLLPVSVRKHLQRLHFRGWRQIPFPNWPVDSTVDALMRQTVALILQQAAVREFPFVWFWPEGHPTAAIVTHDVEGAAGLRFCGELMAMDDRHGIRSAFQVVPEMPGMRGLIDQLRARGFEVNLHDLNHDGFLFHNRSLFEHRVAEINAYARELDCQGFRSGAMYRQQSWFDAFDISYDMSVPNVAHLEPQTGGCCTVMPYFVGRVLELPLTTVQDYSLFHILGQFSTDLWRQQIEHIAAQNGLITVLTHPDYLRKSHERAVYLELLELLVRMRSEKRLWLATPAEVNGWWRERNAMRLIRDGNSWRITGRASERARIAYATLVGDSVVYRL
jgi:hypothetical protein